MKIELRNDPATGVREIVVHLDKDEELLPHEHEELHRNLVEQLMGIEAVSEQPMPQMRISRAQDAINRSLKPQSEHQSERSAGEVPLDDGLESGYH